MLLLAEPGGRTLQAPPSPSGAWTRAPEEYVTLFAPSRHRASYAAYISERPLNAILAEITATSRAVQTPGAWEARPVAPPDVFGNSGQYDIWRLIRLFGGRQPLVARGAMVEAGMVVESWTLLSPYPDPELRSLRPGTLLLILRVP
jgi:hypothetical protein